MFFFRKKHERVLFDAPVAGQRLGDLLERLIGTLDAPEADSVSRVAAICRALPFISEKVTQVALHAYLETKTDRLFNGLRRCLSAFRRPKGVFIS